MKYIVLYIIVLLWINPSGTAAQKPAIILLPSAQEYIHPEVLIDTSFTNDSLIIAIQSDPKKESILESKHREKETGLDISFRKPGNYPLLFKKLNPIKFYIRFTALKNNL